MCQFSFSIARLCPNVLNFCAFYKRYIFSPFWPHLHTNVSYPLMCACVQVLDTMVLPSLEVHICILFICFPFNVSVFVCEIICKPFFHFPTVQQKSSRKAWENIRYVTQFFFSEPLLLIYPFSSCSLVIIQKYSFTLCYLEMLCLLILIF